MQSLLSHFASLDAARDLGLILPTTYNPMLVTLSVLIASLAAYAALGSAGRISASATSVAKRSWLATGAVAMGIGIWAMHFIGMLAFTLPVEVSYDVLITLGSMVPAILASGVVLQLISRERIGAWRLIFGGVLMGSGIGLMHYTGMAAMRMDALMRYDPVLFIVSIVVAVLLSITALYTKFLATNDTQSLVHWTTLGAALVMGLAVSGMHYTGMAAARFYPGSGVVMAGVLTLDPVWLSGLIGLATVLIISLAIFVIVVDRRLEAARKYGENLERVVAERTSQLATANAQITALNEQLTQERDDLEVMLEVTTEHADVMEEELQTRAEELEARSQFVRDTFGRYVSEDVVAQLLDDPEGLELGGEKRTVTIMMSDLRGFTAVAERLDPQEVMRFLNRYLEAMVHVILSYQGTIIEILGDGLLMLFGAPISRDDDPERAVACAVSMQLQIEGVNALLRQENLPEIEMGIGVHTGDVVVGNIGSEQRTKYGVVGSAVNLAGRVESYTTGSQILISPTTYTKTANVLTILQELTVEPKGVPGPMTIYDVGGIGGAHQLFLPEHHEDLSPLVHEIAVSYTVLEGKFAGQEVYAGRFTKLGAKAAEMHADEPVASLDNLKMQLMAPSGEMVPGDLFAKVVGEDPNETDTCVVLRFTSVPQEVRDFLDMVELRYEYHTINRSVQL